MWLQVIEDFLHQLCFLGDFNRFLHYILHACNVLSSSKLNKLCIIGHNYSMSFCHIHFYVLDGRSLDMKSNIFVIITVFKVHNCFAYLTVLSSVIIQELRNYIYIILRQWKHLQMKFKRQFLNHIFCNTHCLFAIGTKKNPTWII